MVIQVGYRHRQRHRTDSVCFFVIVQLCYFFVFVQPLVVYLRIIPLFLTLYSELYRKFALYECCQIDPNDVVDNRTDCESQFNEEFCGEDELDNLW